MEGEGQAEEVLGERSRGEQVEEVLGHHTHYVVEQFVSEVSWDARLSKVKLREVLLKTNIMK